MNNKLYFVMVLSIILSRLPVAWSKTALQCPHLQNQSSQTQTSSLLKAIATSNHQAVQTLIQANADINAFDEEFNISPLLLAVWKNDFDIVNMLLSAEANLEVSDSQGQTPLYLAIDKNYFDIARLLIDAGAHIDFKNPEGITFLHISIYKNALNLVKLLVQKGANIHAKDNYGTTPLDLALNTQKHEIVQILHPN